MILKIKLNILFVFCLISFYGVSQEGFEKEIFNKIIDELIRKEDVRKFQKAVKCYVVLIDPCSDSIYLDTLRNPNEIEMTFLNKLSPVEVKNILFERVFPYNLPKNIYIMDTINFFSDEYEVQKRDFTLNIYHQEKVSTTIDPIMKVFATKIEGSMLYISFKINAGNVFFNCQFILENMRLTLYKSEILYW